MEEVWKDIKDYESYYQVSNLGRVRSLDIIDRMGKHRKGKILAQHADKDGYSYVSLKRNGAQKLASVHRIVASSFIENPNNLPEVDHINCIRNDNKVSNLRWCTRRQNALNPKTILNFVIAQTRYINSSAGRQHIAKLSKPIYLISDNGSIIKRYCSIREAGRDLNINPNNISACCLNKRKQVSGYKFRYADS